MDFFSALSLVVTLVLSLLTVVLLLRPFLSDDQSFTETASKDSEMEAQEKILQREAILDSLEELELARRNNEISDTHYAEKKALIMQDASTLLKE